MNASPPPRAEPPEPSARRDAALPTLMTLYMREVRRFARLLPQHESELLAGIDRGDAQARDALICHHLGFVIAMARGFSNRGLELLDLIEEGNVGMLVALQKFETARGLRFSTYAGFWIRHHLQTALAMQVPIVRPPLRLQMSHDAAPVTPVPMDDEDVEQQLSDAGFRERDVADEVAEQRDAPRVAELLRAHVAQLPARQRDIIVARFGLDGGDECTLQQLSSERGVTRERIRQLQVSALLTLREALESAGVTRDVALAT